MPALLFILWQPVLPGNKQILLLITSMHVWRIADQGVIKRRRERQRLSAKLVFNHRVHGIAACSLARSSCAVNGLWRKPARPLSAK